MAGLLDGVLGGILKPVTDIIGTVIDRQVVDKNKAAEIKLEMLQELQTRGLDQITAQLEINKIEAANASVFVSGWRPFIGWVCGGALAFQYVLAPISLYLAALAGYQIDAPPELDNSLWELVLGMLGMGAMRTFEKVQGVATTKVTGNIAK